MKLKLLISAFALLLFAFSGCTVYSVLYTDHSQDVDFKAYKTFAWLPSDDNDTTNTPYHNQIIESNTKNYFTHEFLARGMTVHLDSPDVLMQLVIKAVNKQKTEQVPISLPIQNQYPYNNSYYGNPYANPYNNPYNYNPYNYPATSPQNPYYNPYPNLYNYNNPFNNTITNYGYTTQIVDYTRSTITLNIIDRKLNKMVWTTTVEGNLYDPVEMQNNLHPAVLRILDSYPVKPITRTYPKKKPRY